MEKNIKVIKMQFEDKAIISNGGIPPRLFNMWPIEDALSTTTVQSLNVSEVVERFNASLTEEDKKKLIVYGTKGEVPLDLKEIFYGTK